LTNSKAGRSNPKPLSFFIVDKSTIKRFHLCYVDVVAVAVAVAVVVTSTMGRVALHLHTNFHPTNKN